MCGHHTSHECRERKSTKAAPDGRQDEAPHLRKVAMSAQRDEVARSRGRQHVRKQTQKGYATRGAQRAVTRFACSQAHRPSLRRRCDVRPFLHLHSGDDLVGTVRGAKQRGLALFDIEPLLSERVDNVWLMRNENGVGARRRRGRKQLAKSVAAAAVLVRRYHETALSKICGL